MEPLELHDLSQTLAELESFFPDSASPRINGLNRQGLSVCLEVSVLRELLDQVETKSKSIQSKLKSYEEERQTLGAERLGETKQTQCTICAETFLIDNNQPVSLYCELTIGDHKQHFLHQVCLTCFKEKAHKSESHVRYFLAQPAADNGQYEIQPIQDGSAPWQILTEVTPVPKKTVLRTDTAELLGLPPEIDFNPKPLINRPFLRLGLKLFEV